MSFNDDVGLDTSQVESGGSGGGAPGGIAVGGGIGGIILLIIGLIFGIDTSGIPTDTSGSNQEQVDGTSGSSADFDKCKTGADANADVQCRVIGTVNSVNAFWTAELPRYQKQWQPTKTVLYTGSTQSQCGTASNQVGPFYCPLDQKVYIDADFFAILTQQFGADSGALAQEYVVAHEYGHALQDQLGLLGRAQQDPSGPNSGGVRIELMADCLAGVWAKNASTTNGAERQALPQGAHRRRHQERPVCCFGRRRRPHPGEDPGSGQPRVLDPRLRGGTPAVVPPGLHQGRHQLVQHLQRRHGLLTRT